MFFSPNIVGHIEEEEMNGACSTHGRGEICKQILDRETRGKWTALKITTSWEYKFKVVVIGVESVGIGWIRFGEYRDR
jgi:hypothetical protein